MRRDFRATVREGGELGGLFRTSLDRLIDTIVSDLDTLAGNPKHSRFRGTGYQFFGTNQRPWIGCARAILT